MPNLIAIKPLEDPYISITWQVNNFCNYRCSYCNEGNWSGKYRNEDNLDALLANLDHIITYFQKYGYVNFKFFFSGGEPTAWKFLIPVINHLKSRLGIHITTGVNTNLSRSVNWWKEHYHLFNDVVASYHPEFAKEDHFFEIIDFLQDKLYYMCIRMMVLEEKFDEVVEIGTRFKSKLKNYNLEWVPLLDEMSIATKPWEYKNPEITEFLKNNNFETNISIDKPKLEIDTSSIEEYDDGTVKYLNSNRLIAENRNFFKGWKCNVNESIFISPSGKMTTASCGQGDTLGNIYSSFKLGLSSVICQKDYCHCGTDILITKHL